MQFLITLGTIIAVVTANRPSYAGFNQKDAPQIESRFSEDTSTNTIANGKYYGITTARLPIETNLVTGSKTWPQKNPPIWLIAGGKVGQQITSRKGVAHGRQPTTVKNKNRFEDNGPTLTSLINNRQNIQQFPDLPSKKIFIPLGNPFDDDFFNEAPEVFL